ncbi:PilN domain-containing protein [Bacillus infantis]|uniref:PilN domain-containing protein n=1 Tax=Bacillus infantis TaxID=324767 RepID=A0A5D4RK12_9BACI|nr:PilN domain-containing protein [Bacillus infantis]TYS51280.1 PilN domain-containing protein [Bacillus infantis]
MLVDINLLPKKEKRSRSVYIYSGAMLLLLAAAAALLFLYTGSKKEEISKVEKQIAQTNAILEIQNAKLTEFESSNAAEKLKEAIAWAEKQPFSMVYVLQEITKILPDRGYIAEFEMDEDNLIKLGVQFDTKSEAAYYLNSLLTLGWLDEAVLKEAKTAEAINEAVEGDSEVSALDLGYLPRYYALYEFKINPEQLKAEWKANEKDNEGGTAP